MLTGSWEEECAIDCSESGIGGLKMAVTNGRRRSREGEIEVRSLAQSPAKSPGAVFGEFLLDFWGIALPHTQGTPWLEWENS
ncbi:hypothetical protein DM860_007812 [Cuscuta australis]|uniref:Uncharacterized protein n=1 Tax=Cuscuta australis TaxID=267555 RepID=A0A328E051_9ASTE|nr:hypothetical protein DM860_007812 [Cuscuta australis]